MKHLRLNCVYTQLEKSVETGPNVLCLFERIFRIDFHRFLPVFWITEWIVLCFSVKINVC